MYKKYTIGIIFIICIHSTTQAQWSTISNTVNIYKTDSCGSVSIGTTTAPPSSLYKLDVHGFISRLYNPSTENNNYTSYQLRGPAFNSGLNIDFFGNTNITSDASWSYYGGAGSASVTNINNAPLVLGTFNKGRIFIAGNGNVTMGAITATPSSAEKLTIIGEQAASTSGQTRLELLQPASSVSANVKLVAGVISGTDPYFAIEARQGTNPWPVVERLRIDSKGNVGIGTTTPASGLEVNSHNGGIHITDNGNRNYLQVGGRDIVAGKGFVFKSSTNGGAYKQLALTVSDGVNQQERLMITRDGKVAIGTANESIAYQDYNLFVTKGIRTEKVKVDVATGWADYVFEDTYKLRPLSEVEHYIKENKHLPDVPSAKEVTKKGIDVAEMDAVLLRKIEELILYMIEQNKNIEAQNNKIKILEEELAKVKK